MDNKQEILDLIQNWVLWRDTGDWKRFETLWLPEGRMHATWFQGPAKDFISANQKGWAKGVRIFHLLGGSSIDVAGQRAIGHTKVTVSQRAVVDGVECDVSCLSRFYDFLEKRDDRWGLALRQGVYDKDRIDPVAPDAALHLDQKLLDGFPAGYRHLAYLQTQIGYEVKMDMPQSEGREIEQLYAQGKAWLAGEGLPVNKA